MDDYEMEESNRGELVDRLSELPLALIHSILSFMPMRDVVFTTFLSKSWRNLWTTVPCLNFREDYYEKNFVDRVLTLWKGIKILKFEIEIHPHFYISSAGDMDLWLQFAVENRVEELNIDLSCEIQENQHWLDAEISVMNCMQEDVYWVPQCLYSCSSITKLKIGCCNLGNYGSPSWNQLKSLTIHVFCFSESSINSILSGSPSLEVFELCFMENNEDLNILSTSLKRLKIHKWLFRDYTHPSDSTVLRICCPNLETLEILGALFSECLFTDVSSITDATIGFRDSRRYSTWHGLGDKVLGDMLRKIFSTIQHVEKVTLSSWCVEAFGGSKKKHLVSPLQNVKFLKLDFCTLKLGDMVDFLGIFPNLKMLVIGYLSFPKPPEMYTEFEANLPNSFLHQLKAVEITSSLFDSSDFWFFELLLKRNSMLEKLVIQVKDIDSNQHEQMSEVAVALQSMPRTSPTAKVILKTT